MEKQQAPKKPYRPGFVYRTPNAPYRECAECGGWRGHTSWCDKGK
jgi:hypothetical protein